MISDLGDKISLTMINFWSWWWEVSNEKDELARAILTVSILILAVFWCRWRFSESRNGTSPLPPGPRGLPILGYLPFLSPNLHETFTDMARCYGPIFKLQLGCKLHVVANTPDMAKAILRDQDEIFANRDPAVAALVLTYGGKDIVWSDNNSYWRNMRKIFVHEVLSNTHLEACRVFRRDEVRKTIEDVYCKVGTRIDINKIVFLTELNVVTSMLWGNSLVEGVTRSKLGAEFREAVSKVIELLGEMNVSDLFPMLARFDLQGVERRMKKQMHQIDEIFDSIIGKRIKEEAVERKGRKDFLQILLELKEQKAFSITQIKALLMDIVVGGVDTTATMTEWTMAEILRNPDIMKKVQDELAEVVGLNNLVEESHLPRLHYLDAVIKETFRLHPPVPLLTPRSPSRSCMVSGYHIPKGSIIMVNYWAIHRDPQYWESPTEFNPERFLNYNGTNKFDYSGNNFAFSPFGSGRRRCPGITLAEKMLKYILASLLHSFDWSLPEGEDHDVSDKFGIVLKKRKPLIMVPSQRLPDASLYK